MRLAMILRNWFRKRPPRPEGKPWLVDREGVAYLPTKRVVLRASKGKS